MNKIDFRLGVLFTLLIFFVFDAGAQTFKKESASQFSIILDITNPLEVYSEPKVDKESRLNWNQFPEEVSPTKIFPVNSTSLSNKEWRDSWFEIKYGEKSGWVQGADVLAFDIKPLEGKENIGDLLLKSEWTGTESPSQDPSLKQSKIYFSKNGSAFDFHYITRAGEEFATKGLKLRISKNVFFFEPPDPKERFSSMVLQYFPESKILYVRKSPMYRDFGQSPAGAVNFVSLGKDRTYIRK
ncbi:hypothetical protein CH373_17075 [Leptospira perolatii]|uniref:SH3b domain-containing protein n=1 Tax=Leptospira perolatii TaxID=2023191 RepID=A0A2M9ZIZ3_9LEPT|nr:hypothetical protein [Leptospira perolatii]PJZ68166.1 hypothetical protein CH360_17645 [Leptospira perolatii]PJZ71944.1 hypothetical protein CH373_17075 [Leptospira perolatii]